MVQAGVIFLSTLFLKENLSLTLIFNQSNPLQISKYVMIVFYVVIALLIGYQLYDDKHKNDYIKWYVSGAILTLIQIIVFISNL